MGDARGSLAFKEPELTQLLDGRAARRDAELLIYRDGLRLRGVARHVEPVGDLGEGQVRRQKRHDPQLRRR